MKIISILFQNIHTEITLKHATVLTYMCLGCKVKNYVNFLSFKKLFDKMRFTDVPLSRKKIIKLFFLIKIVRFNLYQASHNKSLQSRHKKKFCNKNKPEKPKYVSYIRVTGLCSLLFNRSNRKLRLFC